MSKEAMGIRDKPNVPTTPDSCGMANGIFPNGFRRWNSLETLSAGPKPTAAILS